MFIKKLAKILTSSPRNYRTVIIQEEKPNANCLKCQHPYCLEKLNGRYDVVGKPLKTCYGYKVEYKKFT